MRILVLESHPLWIYGLPNGFKDLGHSVKISGPLSDQVLEKLIVDFQPHFILSMGWGPENDSPYKQNRMYKWVKASGIPHVYWATEDPTHTSTFTLPFLKRVQPDFVFTICPFRVDEYYQMGIPSAHLDFGFHQAVHHPTKPVSEYECDIAIVANAYPRKLVKYPDHFRHESLGILVKPLLEANKKIDFHGRFWNEMGSYFGEEIPKEWQHGYLEYPKAYQVYSSAKIVLGLQNHPTQLTQRTYEILGSGGFLLTHDTPEVRRLFTPGRDLVVSSSPEQTVRLVDYYLTRPEERDDIRLSGLKTVQEHSYSARAKYILDKLRSHRIIPDYV